MFLQVTLVALNGLVHYRLLTNRPVTRRWMLVLSAMDIALATASITIASGFDSFIFVAYCPALVLFALVFASVRLGLAWTTMAAVAYSIVSLSLDPGIDRDAGDGRVLVAMYALVSGVCLITRFERRETSMTTAMKPSRRGNSSCSEGWTPTGYRVPIHHCAASHRFWRNNRVPWPSGQGPCSLVKRRLLNCDGMCGGFFQRGTNGWCRWLWSPRGAPAPGCDWRASGQASLTPRCLLVPDHWHRDGLCCRP